MSLKRQRTHQPTPFQLKKEIRRGEISEKSKGGGWWGASAHGGQAARLRVCGFSGNGFGFRRKIAPGLSYSNTTPPSQGVYALYRISIFEVNLQLAEDWIYYVFTDQRHLRIKHY